MGSPTILILGGYGLAGAAIARLLLQHTDSRMVLAGRSLEKAQAQARTLNDAFPGERVSGVRADAADPAALEQALAGVDLLLVASSTAQYVREVAQACLETGVDYLDIQYSSAKFRALQALEGDIRAAGRCFITEGGFHPGIPAALVRYAAGRIDHLERAVVGCALRVDWSGYRVTDATAEEFITELLDYEALVFRAGRWEKARLWSTRDFITLDFGDPIGKVMTVPMLLEEMRALPDMIPTLKETGFYISGFNWFVDWILFPLVMAAAKVWPGALLLPAGRLLFWGLETFSKPPYNIVLQLEAQGKDPAGTLTLRLAHEDGYFLTAAPTVACIMQYLDGDARQPGLHCLAHVVAPAAFLEDMKMMGVSIQEETVA